MKGKATKKPIPIDFFQWNGDFTKLQDWVNSLGENPDEVVEYINDTTIKVKTLEGSSYTVPHDYIIIRGIKGEYYPCELQIFKESYNYENK